MNYHDIKKCDMLNGDGIRVSLWVAGCEHQCFQCQNPQTWDIKGGIPFDEGAEQELYEALKEEWVSGITFTGGDPLHSENIETVSRLIDKIHSLHTDKTIWLYTGYKLDQCLNDPQKKEVVFKCDVVVDGEFVLSLKDPTLKWVGSSNQKIWRNLGGSFFN